MTQIVNNVDLDKVAQTAASGKKDKSTLRKPVKLQGEWTFYETEYLLVQQII
jgi:hypothetical protein